MWRLAREFVNTNHSYIRWADRPSRKLYWLLYTDGLLSGVFGLGSAYARPKPIVSYMEEHSLKFNEVANNIVYCLAAHDDRNAGSRFLSLCRRDAVKWWGERYGDALRAFQTFILPPRTGAVYKADNWKQLGTTTGGMTQTVRTLTKEQGALDPKAERRVFKSGEIRYLLRSFTRTESKLIFMRISGA